MPSRVSNVCPHVKSIHIADTFDPHTNIYVSRVSLSYRPIVLYRMNLKS